MAINNNNGRISSVLEIALACMSAITGKRVPVVILMPVVILKLSAYSLVVLIISTK